MNRRHHVRRSATPVVSLVLMLLSLLIVLSAAAQEETPTPELGFEVTETVSAPESTVLPVPTETPPAESTDDPLAEMTVEATSEATEEAAEMPTSSPTDAPPDEPKGEPTEESRELSLDEGDPPMIIMPLMMQTFCLMNIDDLGDDNPFTYGFTAVESYNIASYQWDLGDGTTANTQTVASHTYAATGTYNITLTCTPQAGYGSQPLVLTGSIEIATQPVAAFSLTPATEITGLPPFAITTVNQSTGGALTYAWTVRDEANVVLYTSSDENITYTFSTYGMYTFELVVTDGAGITAGATQSVTLNAPAPQAHFSMTPANGITPLDVTVEGIDLETGPITSWSWDFGDGTVLTNAGPGPHTHTYTLDDGAEEGEVFTIMLTYAGPGGNGTFARTIGVYPDSRPVTAQLAVVSSANVDGGIEVCFENQSTGPVAISQWDWEYGGSSAEPYDETNNSAIVCHVYSEENTYSVRLFVQTASGTETSTASVQVQVWLAPVAVIDVTPSSGLFWGDEIDLDGSRSTPSASIVAYSWDFNGDGAEDSNLKNPQNVKLTQLGNVPIRLTVTSFSGAKATAEVIINVARRDITCSFTGSTNVLPGSGAQTYTSTVSGANYNGLTRAVSYQWTITGAALATPLEFTSANINVDWSTFVAGAYQVTLEVTADDGASCADSQTVNVTYPALDCDISHNLPSQLFADGKDYTFTANVGNLASRPVISYQWYVDGVPVGTNSATLTRSWDIPPVTATDSVIRYEVVVDNGGGMTANCADEITVTLNPWPDPVCAFTATPPSPLYPNGNTYTFQTSVGDTFGRPITGYKWYINGIEQSGATAASFSWQNIDDTTLVPYSRTIRFEATVDNGNGTSSSCSNEHTVNVSMWPPLTCSIGGNGSPIPALPDDVNRSYAYTANVNGIEGRDVSYQWAVSSGAIVSGAASSQASIRWQAADSSAAPGTDSTINLNVTVTNPDGSTVNTTCSTNRTVKVQVPRLTCNPLSGDFTPVVGETNVYNRDLRNIYGRSIVMLWELEQNVGGTWTPVTTGSGTSFSYQFLNPATSYRLRYGASASDPADNCASNWQPLTVTEPDENFYCDAFATVVGNTFNVTSSSTNYTYRADIDNGNAIPLHYTWSLIRPGGTINQLTTSTSNGNGLVASPAFSGASLAPEGIGNYRMRVDVRAVNNTDSAAPGYSTYTCAMEANLIVGTIQMGYSYVDNQGASIDNTKVAVGREICITNTSLTSHTGIDGLTYQWEITSSNADASANSLGITSHSGQQLPGCVSFSNPGTYTIRVTGTNHDQGDSAFRMSSQYSRTFNVWGLQSISINRTNRTFAPATLSFTAVGTNIFANSYVWSFYNSSNQLLGTANGATVNRLFQTPDTYRVVVTGTGNLGQTTAETQFTLRDTNSLRAAFTPSQYGGIAPMTVCFTDNSESGSPANPITSWSWDFDFHEGETRASADLNYTAGNKPGSVCHTYTTPASTYTVKLWVSNTGLEETATNTIRTYSAMESSASFSVTPNGTGQYCFAAILTGSVSVTGWDFGDGSTGGAVNTVCHTYASSGTFVVRMNIRHDTSGEEGTVIRSINVSLDPSTTPNLTVAGSCSADRTATFRVTNTGGAMTTPDQVIIRDGDGTIIAMFTMQVASGAYQDFVVANRSGAVTFSTIDHPTLTASTNCNYPPELSISAACTGSLPVFTITNNRPVDGPMWAAQTFTISDSTGEDIYTGTFQLTSGQITYEIPVPPGNNPYETYTFNSSGTFGTLNASRKCADQPVLQVTTVCAYPIVFTITNTSAYDMVIPQTYNVTSGVTTVIGDTAFQLAAGASTTVTLTGLDPYAGYTLTSDNSGFAGSYTSTSTCARPQLTITSTCAYPIEFTITNNGGAMLTAQSFTVVNTGGTQVANGSLNLAAGTSTTVTLTGLDPYAGYTLTSSNGGFAGTYSQTQNCTRPALQITSTCAYPIAFTVENTGGDMLTAQSYTVANGNGEQVVSSTLNLDAGGNTTVTLTGLDPYAGYTFETAGFASDVTVTQNCERPALEITSDCAYPIEFTITNSGGDMLTPQIFTVVNGDGDQVESGNLNLAAGASTTVTLTGLDPYAGYTLTSSNDGFAGTYSQTQNCQRPNLQITSTCAYPIAFTVENTGGDMLTPQAFTVVNGAGDTIVSDALDLDAGAARIVTMSDPDPLDPYAGYTFETAGFAGDVTVTQNCARPQLTITSTCAYPIEFTITNNGGAMLTAQSYTVVNSTGDQVANGTIDLDADANATVTLTGLDPYAGYTLTSSNDGFAGTYTTTQNCERPVLTATSTCAYPIEFTISNSGGAMLTPQEYIVVNSTGDQVANADINLTANADMTVTLSDLDPYAGYQLTSSGFAGALDRSQNCDRPQLSADFTCADPANFTLYNTGGDMLTAQTFTVTSADDTVVMTDDLMLAQGESANMTLTGENPYSAYTVMTDGFAGAISVERACATPRFVITNTCESPASLFIRNVGGDTFTEHTFTLINNSRNVTPTNNAFSLKAGETMTIDASQFNLEAGVMLTTDTYGVTAYGSLQCFPPASYIEVTPTPLPSTNPSGFSGVESALDLPDWNTVQTCGYGCPEFRVYHTDETGDWEIFRLDGANPETRETFRQNLSFGDDSEDMAPSLSPNNAWVIFSSNRDGNWELYVASTSGDPSSLQRVTYNTIALDTDPMWGPTNYVVFETTRHGSWDLYMVDMRTGQEFRVTDSEGNDINPFWSPDGSTIVFQSDREDENGESKWQLYEYNLFTRATTRLSDGTRIDVDPQYSNDGARIVYRTYAAEGDNSVIALMDADGQNRRPITETTEDATNPVWSPDDRLIAYQSDKLGDLDIYIYDVVQGETRQLTDNDIDDYAPTWECSSERVIFTSNHAGNPDLFEADALPVSAPPIALDDEADQQTFELANDIYPESGPSEENASREGQTVIGAFGEQTRFLNPATDVTPEDLSLDGVQRDDWTAINSCPAS